MPKCPTPGLCVERIRIALRMRHQTAVCRGLPPIPKVIPTSSCGGFTKSRRNTSLQSVYVHGIDIREQRKIKDFLPAEKKLVGPPSVGTLVAELRCQHPPRATKAYNKGMYFGANRRKIMQTLSVYSMKYRG